MTGELPISRTSADELLDELVDLSMPAGTPPAAASRLRRRSPLVYATAGVLDQARQLLPGQVLEREVAGSIMAGRFKGGQRGGLAFGDAWTATVVRVPGRVRPRPRAWLVTRLEPFERWSR